jgi:phosphotransferase system enzyme I (PtsI)
MPSPAEFRGRPAAEGTFHGRVVEIGSAQRHERTSGDPATERLALEAAVTAAVAAIAALAAKSQGAAAAMLDFQIAMLQDEELLAPALAAISRGAGAGAAWLAAMETEIAGYRESEDEHFRARAADLLDIRDRVLRGLSGDLARRPPQGVILAADDLPPTLFLEADWSEGGAIALRQGSPSSHVAMLARACGIPMVVGLGEAWPAAHVSAIVDGGGGIVIATPSPEQISGHVSAQASGASRRATEQQYLERPAMRPDGTRIEVMVNISDLAELERTAPSSCDGVGLMRSEFLFRDGAALPGEDEQYRSYRRVLDWAAGRPVTIRTLDVGGDKPIRGLTEDGDKNPFLGLRGIRLSLARPEVFRTQLRALARAAVHGNLKVMIPMVTLARELGEAAALLDQCLADLAAEGTACARPPLGIMIEVPAAALAPELLSAAAFFSIGSNDLTQYVMAAARDRMVAPDLDDPSHPAVLRLIANVVSHGKTHGIPVSLCGDMAGEPSRLPLLLAAGLTSLSVSPAALPRVKATIAET